MMRQLLFLLVLVLCASGVSAQEERSAKDTRTETAAQSVVHVSEFIQNLRAQDTKTKAGTPLRVERLINDAQPSAYVENGRVKVYGDKPVCLYTDVRSLPNLANLDVPSRKIEIVTVKIKSQSELSAINLSVLEAFPNVKYVYLVSEVKIPAQTIKGTVRNTDPNIGVFYNILETH